VRRRSRTRFQYRRTRAAPWIAAYRWPILCFVAVAFWNAVGAGLLGFLINPPASLCYVQGLNTTPAHGHGALFGVYEPEGTVIRTALFSSCGRLRYRLGPRWDVGPTVAFVLLNPSTADDKTRRSDGLNTSLPPLADAWLLHTCYATHP